MQVSAKALPDTVSEMLARSRELLIADGADHHGVDDPSMIILWLVEGKMPLVPHFGQWRGVATGVFGHAASSCSAGSSSQS